MTTSVVFTIMAVIFFIAMVVIGLATKNWASNADDFALAGREVGTAVGISAVIAISFAGSNLTLIPSFTIEYGFLGAGLWCVLFSVGFIVYALLPGKYLRRCGAQTLPEWLQMRYSGPVRILVSVGSVVGLCGIMANNIASFSQLLTAFTGIPGWVSIALCFLVMILFTVMSGQWAVKVTCLIQVIIGAISIPLAVFLIGNIFGWDFTTNWPNTAGWFVAGQTGQSLPIFSVQYPSFLTFLILNAFFLVWGSNYFFLNAACMRSEKVMKKSFFGAAILQIPFVYLPLILVGILAVCNTPEGYAPLGSLPPTAAFSVMLLNLSAAAASFAMVGGMCASISTASTALVAAQATATRDIYLRKIKPNATPAQALSASRVIVVLIGVVCLLMTFYPGGPTYLFAFSNAWMGPPAVLLLLGMFWPRVTNKGALWGVSLGMIVMAVLTVLDLAGIFSIGVIMHVGMAGLIVTVVITVVGSLLSQPKYFGQREWVRDPGQGPRQDIALTALDKKVLVMLDSGFDQMVELADFFSGETNDINVINESVERLDQGGYLIRASLRGAGFYSFQLTEKGKEEVCKEGKSVSPQDEVSPQGLEILRAIQKKELAAYAKYAGLSSSALSAWFSVLERKGFVKQVGFMRRHVVLSQAGKKLTGR